MFWCIYGLVSWGLLLCLFLFYCCYVLLLFVYGCYFTFCSLLDFMFGCFDYDCLRSCLWLLFASVYCCFYVRLLVEICFNSVVIGFFFYFDFICLFVNLLYSLFVNLLLIAVYLLFSVLLCVFVCLYGWCLLVFVFLSFWLVC